MFGPLRMGQDLGWSMRRRNDPPGEERTKNGRWRGCDRHSARVLVPAATQDRYVFRGRLSASTVRQQLAVWAVVRFPARKAARSSSHRLARPSRVLARRPANLSGGEMRRQRVRDGRALLAQPRLLSGIEPCLARAKRERPRSFPISSGCATNSRSRSLVKATRSSC